MPCYAKTSHKLCQDEVAVPAWPLRQCDKTNKGGSGMKTGFVAASRCLGRWMAAGALVALMTGCGGGGGDDGGGNPGANALNLNLARIQTTGTTQRAFENRSPRDGLSPVTITADVTGDLNRLNGQTIYIVVEDPDALFESNPWVTLSSDGIGNRIELFPRSTFGRQGSYRRPLRVNVCLDAPCQRHLGGSPFEVPLQIDVLPGLRLGGTSPLVIDLPFGAPPPEVTVPLSAPANATSLYPSTSQPDILTAQMQDPLALLLRMQLLPVGSYPQTVRVITTAMLDGRLRSLEATLPVTLNIQPTAGVSAIWAPASVALSTVAGQIMSTDATVLAADGARYVASRVEYLPASADGNADAGGIQWLRASVNTAPNQPLGRSTVWPFTDACELPPSTRCLAPGRYDALIFMRTIGELESLPLRVTVTVRP